MGVEILLLFGLGITGVVLTNLLSGEATLTDPRPVGVRPSPTAVGASAVEAARAVEPVPEVPLATEPPASALVLRLVHEPPRLWGHPAPLARLVALLALGAVALGSAVWGIGWLVARAIAQAVAGVGG